jgi:ribonuclease P/MRP protein subunit RPP40
MERIIVQQTLAYLRRVGVISRQQHGFLADRSTTTNLLETLNDWIIALQDRKSVIAAYIDFSKAFNMVSHVKLLSKLKSYGIKSNLLAWIQAFLTGRTQQTRVGHQLSPASQILSGVVQGSVIGPLLFLLFISDLRPTW